MPDRPALMAKEGTDVVGGALAFVSGGNVVIGVGKTEEAVLMLVEVGEGFVITVDVKEGDVAVLVTVDTEAPLDPKLGKTEADGAMLAEARDVFVTVFGDA